MAIQLRIAGLTEREIAQKVGLSQSRVSRIIKQALQQRRQQSADELRAVEGARVEELHRALWPSALKGNLGAANVVLKAADRRARLFGLDEGSGEAGAGDSRMVVAVVCEAFVVDSPETMEALHADAQALGLMEAQKIMPGYTADGAVSRLVWYHNAAGSWRLTPDVYRAALVALSEGRDPGIGV